jgi:hypothetical protein
MIRIFHGEAAEIFQMAGLHGKRWPRSSEIRSAFLGAGYDDVSPRTMRQLIPPDMVHDCVRSRQNPSAISECGNTQRSIAYQRSANPSSFPVHTTVRRLTYHWMERGRKYSHSPIHWGRTPAFRFCLGRLYSPGQSPISISWGLIVHGRRPFTLRSRQAP